MFWATVMTFLLPCASLALGSVTLEAVALVLVFIISALSTFAWSVMSFTVFILAFFVFSARDDVCLPRFDYVLDKLHWKFWMCVTGYGTLGILWINCWLYWVWCDLLALFRVPPGHGKSWNLGRPFSIPGKSWKIAKVIEKSWKMMIMSRIFYYCTEQFCKSDKTSFIKSNYEP